MCGSPAPWVKWGAVSAAPRDARTWQWAHEMGTQVEWGTVEMHGHKGGSQEAVGVVMVRKLEDVQKQVL